MITGALGTVPATPKRGNWWLVSRDFEILLRFKASAFFTSLGVTLPAFSVHPAPRPHLPPRCSPLAPSFTLPLSSNLDILRKTALDGVCGAPSLCACFFLALGLLRTFSRWLLCPRPQVPTTQDSSGSEPRTTGASPPPLSPSPHTPFP